MATVAEALKSDPCRRCQPGECSPEARTRLSLTRELNSGGCAHHYLKTALPGLQQYVKTLRLPHGDTVTRAPKGWEAFARTAFDRRLRYEYQPGYTGEAVTAGVELLARKGLDIRDGINHPDPGQRALYAAIAGIECRSGHGRPTLESLQNPGSALREQLAGDLAKLVETARECLVLKDPEFGPTFGGASLWIGGADAGLIDSGCLIGIKCVKLIQATGFIRQAVAYALLDVHDRYQLDSAGIYLARQGILWRASLEQMAQWNGTTLRDLRQNAPWGETR